MKYKVYIWNGEEVSPEEFKRLKAQPKPRVLTENERYMLDPDGVAEAYALRRGNYPG